ncbi:hypothetical protein EZJ19_15040 [Parasulfuritortus cantonensis]|uniref:Uncharacterized protein n=1 Tax=Parasulfuritortus cantonensis TaxID=2528202 RepID=A0A4R1B7I2_9PROT|nr:hypothetical protein [Parasulfuritortus cantonensis]TCJ11589.1 hypothetical protein EZJ19_15040 [Parasulfuritortus cantonensis]
MNTLLDVVIGLTLVFFLAAMLCSGVQEILARTFSARGRLMRDGLVGLIPDRWLYLRLLNHPMVAGLYRGRPGKGDPPSYLPARNFALALADTLILRHRLRSGQAAELTLDDLIAAVRDAKAKDLGVGHALLPVVEAATDLEAALAGIETWFDSAMERVTGWYKSYSQKRLFVIGLVVAAAFNIDTIQIAASLSRSAEVRAQAVALAGQLAGQDAEAAQASVDARAQLRQLAAAGLPIGYTCLSPKPVDGNAKAKVVHYRDCLQDTLAGEGSRLTQKLLGWLLTALATTLGAPFWFDAMKKLVNVRNSGPSPVRKAAASG